MDTRCQLCGVSSFVGVVTGELVLDRVRYTAHFCCAAHLVDVVDGLESRGLPVIEVGLADGIFERMVEAFVRNPDAQLEEWGNDGSLRQDSEVVGNRAQRRAQSARRHRQRRSGPMASGA